jgi:hypothetical protein
LRTEDARVDHDPAVLGSRVEDCFDEDAFLFVAKVLNQIYQHSSRGPTKRSRHPSTPG